MTDRVEGDQGIRRTPIFWQDPRQHPVDGAKRRTDHLLKAIKDVQLWGDQINDLLGMALDVRHLQVVQNGQRVEKDLNPNKNWDEPELLDVRLRAPVAVYPNRANRRIRAQSGCFTLHGGTFHPEPERFKADKLERNYIGLPVTLHEIDETLFGHQEFWEASPSATKMLRTKSVILQSR